MLLCESNQFIYSVSMDKQILKLKRLNLLIPIILKNYGLLIMKVEKTWKCWINTGNKIQLVLKKFCILLKLENMEVLLRSTYIIVTSGQRSLACIQVCLQCTRPLKPLCDMRWRVKISLFLLEYDCRSWHVIHIFGLVILSFPYIMGTS